jgi:HK97 family phage major capsid protein
MSEKLKTLQASWQQKHDEANVIISKENATGEELAKAEKLFDERDAIGKSIEEETAHVDRTAKLKGRAAEGRRFATEPAGPMIPTKGSADGTQFKVAGSEEAGYARIDTETKRLVEEVGPGTFGEKAWEVMQTFEYRKDFIQYLRSGAKGQRVIDRCVKTLQEGLDDQGGVFAPADLIMRVVGRLPAPTSLRGRCQQFTTGRDIIKLPKKQYSSDDKYTTAFRAISTGEIPSSSTVHAVTDTNLLGEVEVPVHTYMLSAPVTFNMLEDSAFNFQAWLESELNQIIDLLYEDQILNGNGVRNPIGITNNPGASDRPEVVLSGSAAAIAFDGLVDLWTALAPQYDQNGIFVMNKKSTYRALCKIKDSQNRPLFGPEVQTSPLLNDRGMTLQGYPIVFSQFSQDIGASNYPIVFGDLRGYYLVNRLGFSLRVLDQVIADQNQVKLLGRLRFGGAPIEHWRMKLQKSNNS